MKFMLPANFAPKAYLKRALRRHLGGVGKSPDGRAQKMAKLEAHLRPDMPRKTLGGKLDFLTEELRKQARIAETDNISSNDYDENGLALIEKYMDGLILDCGAGRRSVYYKNVVNYEIVNYDSTDVIGIGEELPFKDGTFDAVISVAVLEHVRDPFKCAREIVRVLKPGGDLYCCIPFLQPLHGFPHHYFNATPQGIRALFEDSMTVTDVSVLASTHPIWSLTWILNIWRKGLPTDARKQFDSMRVADLLGNPLNYLAIPFCSDLPQSSQLEIASATVLRATKPDGAKLREG
jgi:SAM-dependent methyltransferase